MRRKSLIFVQFGRSAESQQGAMPPKICHGRKEVGWKCAEKRNFQVITPFDGITAYADVAAERKKEGLQL
jgi:hypothetical protein